MNRHPTIVQRILSSVMAAACVVAQLALPPGADAAQAGGSTASAGSVLPPSVTAVQGFQPDLFTGRAVTSIPIGVPPGPRGVQPQLALTYASTGGNSWVGVGWSLDVGAIERSTKTGVPAYGTSDQFALVLGGSSTELAATPSEGAGRYRAKEEGAFFRIEDKGSAGWEARDKAGTIYRFGQTLASRLVDPANSARAFRWGLDEVVDVYGNRMTISYRKPSFQFIPDRIRYGFVPGTTLASEVTFTTGLAGQYSNHTRRPGFLWQTEELLAAIDIAVPVQNGTTWQMQAARRYELGYDTSGRTSRPLLQSVTQVGATGSRLPAVTFSYQSASLPTYAPADLGGNPMPKAQMAADVDGDGLAEVINFDGPTQTWTVGCPRRSCPFTSGTWLVGFGNAESIPIVGDFNGDGRADVGSYSKLHSDFGFSLSDGTQFVQRPDLAFPATAGTPFAGDFNGDGYTDVGVWDNGRWSVALNKGAAGGFQPLTVFALALGATGAGTAIYVGDFNGDGLTDVATLTDRAAIGFSDGHQFVADAWTLALGGPYSTTTGDFNGDGLTDVAQYPLTGGNVAYWLSKGRGFETVGVTIPNSFSCTGSGCSLQLGDFNGDGLVDPAVFDVGASTAQLVVSTGTASDLLSRIDNGLGGVTTIAYRPSQDASDGTWTLPFIMPVVRTVTTSDSRGHDVPMTYAFTKGSFNTGQREFRGFGHVEAQDPDGTIAATDFLQGDHTKGRPSATEVRAAGGTWTKSINTWTERQLLTDVWTAELSKREAQVCNGDASCVSSISEFTYDAYGNVTVATDDGDAADAADDRRTVTTYHNNTAAWILGKPKLIQTYDAASGGTVLAQRRFYYDGSTNLEALPSIGRLTKEEEWLKAIPPATQDSWFATTLAYTPRGNVTQMTDARGNATYTYYDATETYVTQLVNALQQMRQFTYDRRYGQVTSAIDQNSQTTTTGYDDFGRVTSVTLPGETLPSETRAYQLGAPLSVTTTCRRTQLGGAELLCGKALTDGLGRTIQTRSPAQATGQEIVAGTVDFNRRGLVDRQWLPFPSADGTAYVSPPSTPAPVQYEYDPLGRLTRTIQPNGDDARTAYGDRVATETDLNGHQVRRTEDAYGRLVTVEELGETTVPVTTYAYDDLDRLTEVRYGSATIYRVQLTYDTLGRKIQMVDPDLGTWKYAYDAVDNLATQTDARGVATNFVYDALNRLATKSYTIPTGSTVPNPGAVAYTYDDTAVAFSTGRLTKVTDGSGSTSFAYDRLGRTTTETKRIGTTDYPVIRTYDLLGRVTSLKYPDGDVATYTHTRQGGVRSLTLQSGATSTPIVTAIDYDAGGQLTRLAYGNGVTTTQSYDSQTQRLTSLTSTGPAGALQGFGYEYDKAGNVTRITDAQYTGGQSFTYDARHRLTQAVGAYGTETYRYDSLGNLTQHAGLQLRYESPRPHAVTSTTGAAALTLTYDANGNVATRAEGALTQTFSFDAENRLADVRLSPSETITIHFKPGWNVFSLPVIPSDASVAAVLPSFSANFEQVAKYDAATQTFTHYTGIAGFDDFTSFDYGVGYEVYCTNPAGVTVAITGTRATSLSKSLAVGWHLLPAVSLQRDTLPRVFGALAPAAIKTADAAGSSLVAATDVQPAQAYFVQLPAAKTWTPPLPTARTQFVYDGDGGRVKTIDDGGTTVHVGELIDARGSQTTKYLYVGDQRVASQSTTDGLRFEHGDHLGSVHVVTNTAGQRVELSEHRPFGAVSRQEGSAAVTHGFTSQREGELRGLIVFPARIYDPTLGRFLQPDPISQDPTDPQTLNRYSYVANNPTNFIDPTGYSFWTKFFRIVAIVAAAVAVVATAGTLAPAIVPGLASTALFTSAVGETLLAAAPTIIGTAIATSASAAGISAGLPNGSASNGSVPSSGIPIAGAPDGPMPGNLSPGSLVPPGPLGPPGPLSPREPTASAPGDQTESSIWIVPSGDFSWLDGPTPLTEAWEEPSTVSTAELPVALSVTGAAPSQLPGSGIGPAEVGVTPLHARSHKKNRSKRNWDKHTKRRPGQAEKKDWRMKYHKGRKKI